MLLLVFNFLSTSTTNASCVNFYRCVSSDTQRFMGLSRCMMKMVLAFCYKFFKMTKMKHVWSVTMFADYVSAVELNAADGCFANEMFFFNVISV